MAYRGRLEPFSPAGRFFTQPSIQLVIHAVFTTANPIDTETLKNDLRSTFLERSPRFSSILVRDRNGRENWKRVEHVDMDKHVFEIGDDQGAGPDFVTDYVASLAVSTPLDTAKPLWEVHVLPQHRCFIMRLHHALGDGVSLMSLFLSGCRRVDDPRLLPTIPGSGMSGRRAKAIGGSLRAGFWRLFLVAWYTLAYAAEMVLRSFWVKDATTALSGGEGVELWPRKLEVATFSLADMKNIKDATGATINDVLMGVIASGFAKYLDHRSPELKKPVRISGLAMVNTRQHPVRLQEISKTPSDRWSTVDLGNRFGYILLPFDLHEGSEDPLRYVRSAKAMMEKKKLSLEAHFSYASGAMIMSLLGPKVATAMNYRIVANTTFTLSNVVGPSEEISFAGNPIETFGVSTTSLSHAITLHMVTYKGMARLQILVAKDIIPDSDFLKKCFEDSLDDMKKQVLINAKKQD